jgi:hypothetical protein
MPVTRPRPKKERPKTWDEKFWEEYEPPIYLKNRYVVAAGVCVALGAAWYSAQLH